MAAQDRDWNAPPTDERGEPATIGEFNGHEIYPMPMFATLAVADVAGAAAWYEAALGFASVFRAPAVNGQPAMVHLRRRKYQDLLLTPASGDTHQPSGSLTLTFNADGEVDQLAERACSVAAAGRSSVSGPFDTPWNTRDVRVTDPAGHRLVFTSRQANPDPGQVARMRAMFDATRQK